MELQQSIGYRLAVERRTCRVQKEVWAAREQAGLHRLAARHEPGLPARGHAGQAARLCARG